MQTDQDLKSLTKKELHDELKKAREEALKQSITVKTRHNKDTSAVGKKKKYVARILTTLSEIRADEIIEKESTLK